MDCRIRRKVMVCTLFEQRPAARAGALANNRFEKIKETFRLSPSWSNRYTHLMPHYVFAVLLGKVVILRQAFTGAARILDEPSSSIMDTR